MKKLTFTTPTPDDFKEAGYPFDKVLWYIDAAPKERLELVLGQLTDQQYVEHIIQRNLQVNPRLSGLTQADLRILEIPISLEFRDAWCDVTPQNTVDIDLSRAKQIKLFQMRRARQKKFDALGFPVRLAPELEEAIVSPENKAKLKALRDATEPLKALNATGYNDETILEQIRQLGELNVTI